MAREVIVSTPHKVLVIPHRADVAALVPNTQRVDWQGEAKLVVPHTVDTTRLLRNLDIPAPSPMLTRYRWGGRKPWDVQEQTAAMLTVSPRAYVFNQMRTGKTYATLGAAEFLIEEGMARKVLVVAPLSTLNLVWGREILTGFPHRKYQVLYGTRKRRLQRLAEDADFYIINHDGVEVIARELEARKDIDIVVFDEVAVYRERRTARWRMAQAVSAGRKYVWGLTGAPTPNAPSDAFGIGRLITPERMPKYFKDFRDATMLKVSQFKWVPKLGATEVVFNTLRPSVRFTRSDVKESPPTLYLDRECELSPVASRLMKALIDKCRTEIAGGKAITAVNAGVLINKLMQIACGWVYDDKGDVLDVSSPSRLHAVAQLLAETDRKALVFMPYIHAVEGMTSYLRKQGYDVDMVYGDTPTKERDRIFSLFQNTDKYDALVCHPQCMAHGLTLTAADMAIWAGVPPGNEVYCQANERIALPGLTYPTAVVHIVGSAAEKRRYRGLRQQESTQQTLLGMLEGMNEE